ncbi:hypothetical protein DL771_007411 [Monosporascus sp. 5C6A]|nr:hypothetical protein DL771_007411 [Monosporascus sp. 5C6A]
MRSTLAIFLASLGMATLAQCSNYASTCQECHMWNGHNADNNGHLLKCYCFGGRFHPNDWSELHLNERIGNANGQLVYNSAGHRGSCKDFILHYSEYWATCTRADGSEARVMIDLNHWISNRDGRLSFD